ncbi:MAG: DUF4190 domain-containing protein, partial [Phycisphaerales bacterium]|nr:DUF4190 domain-containing protein [Phycisphaerales bacterium]
MYDDPNNPYAAQRNQPADDPWGPDPGSAPPAGRNVLGIVGFILAFIIPPLGLILSLIALFSRPRGFAIAGAVVGAIMSTLCGGCIGGVVVLWPVIGKGVAAVTNVERIVTAAEEFSTSHSGRYPADEKELGFPTGLPEDPWGTPMRYEPADDGKSFTIRLAGPDRTLNTSDDTVINSALSQRQRQNAINKPMEQLLEEWRKPTPTPTP